MSLSRKKPTVINPIHARSLFTAAPMLPVCLVLSALSLAPSSLPAHPAPYAARRATRAPYHYARQHVQLRARRRADDDGPSTRELRRVLAERSIDTAGVFERAELLRLLEASDRRGATSAASSIPVQSMSLQEVMDELDARSVAFDVLAPRIALCELLETARGSAGGASSPDATARVRTGQDASSSSPIWDVAPPAPPPAPGAASVERPLRSPASAARPSAASPAGRTAAGGTQDGAVGALFTRNLAKLRDKPGSDGCTSAHRITVNPGTPSR